MINSCGLNRLPVVPHLLWRHDVTRPLSVCRVLFAAAIVFAVAGHASAQATDDAAALDLAETDFSVVNLPTTLRLPAGKSDFHLTHRFGGNLRSGSFGD